MKKFLILPLIFVFFAIPAFSSTGFEIGLGSGYVSYGGKSTKNLTDALGEKNQSVIYCDASFLIQPHKNILFALGSDCVSDFRWKGKDHIYLIDYAFLAGFRVYPNLAGLFFGLDYAVGRRSDFVSLNDHEYSQDSRWGNGFKFALGYDFSCHLNSIAPVLAASFKSMPRGNCRDNIFCVSLKLTKH